MLKKGILITIWFPLAVISLLLNVKIARTYQKPTHIRASEHIVEAIPFADASFDEKNTQTGKVLSTSITSADGREEMLRIFMSGSPLEPYAGKIIEQADKYELDYRILPAIAMCESNLGVKIPTQSSHNAWGIAVYTGQEYGAEFNNWEYAIEWVTKFIHKKFVESEIIDIKEIGAIWAPPSVEKGDSWANCVRTFMKQME